MLFPHLTKCCIDPATGQTWKNLTQEDKRYIRRRSSSTCFYNSVRSWCSLTGWFFCPLLEWLRMLPYPHSDKKNLSLLIFEYHIILCGTISHISVSPHSFILEIWTSPHSPRYDKVHVMPPSIYYEGGACAKCSDDNALKAQLIMIYSAFSGLKRQTEA